MANPSRTRWGIAQSPPYSASRCPPGNIFGAPEGIYEPAVSEGFWLLLAPLPPGEHVIHFSAATSDGVFSLDVTVHSSRSKPAGRVASDVTLELRSLFCVRGAPGCVRSVRRQCRILGVTPT